MPAMRVIIEVTGGPDKGRKQHLTANQVITVGRTDWADFAVSQDARMSGEHFSLQVDGDTCRLRDLESTNGTQVNGRPVKQADLKDGDEIVAGDTHFAIRIGAVSGVTLTNEPRPFIPVPVKRPEEDHATPEIVVTVNADALYQAQCGIALLPPRELLDRVQRLYPVYMIVDFGRLGIPRPAELLDPQALFNWLPESAAALSPVIIDVQSWPGALELIESGWGSDAVICLGSQRPPQELVDHLRSCARMRRDSVLGYCWPSVLSALLMNCAHEMVKRLMDGIDLVLAENPDDPAQWQVFSFTNLQMIFDNMGLPTVADTPSR